LLIVTVLVGMILLGYGFYGFFMVKSQQAESGAVEPACPFGAGGGFFGGSQSGPFSGGIQILTCSYAFECLIAGVIILGFTIKSLVKK